MERGIAGWGKNKVEVSHTENLSHFTASEKEKMLEGTEKMSAGTELYKDPFRLVKTHSLPGEQW